MEPAWIDPGRSTWASADAAFLRAELLVAALGARGLFVVDERVKALKPVFNSGDRIRDVLPVGGDLYVITTNCSARTEGPSNDRLLRLSRAR